MRIQVHSVSRMVSLIGTLFLLLLMLLRMSSGAEKRVLIHYGGCDTASLGPGKCLPPESCDLPVTPDANDAQCRTRSGLSLVCCPSNTAAVPRFAARTDDGANSMAAWDELPRPPHCGSVLTDRIYNGEHTNPLEFPWTALIEYTTGAGEQKHYCGGSFIAQRWVLTAAHCVLDQFMTNGTRLTGVRLGEWNRATNPDCTRLRSGADDCIAPHLDVAVDRVVAHARFDYTQYTHDIALLRLARAVDWHELRHVRAICLPFEPTVRDDQLAGAAVDVAGWGRTERNDEPSDIKRKAVLTVWRLENCKSRYRIYGYTLGEAQLCATGAPGVDTCRGDSGGPLMMETRDEQRQPYYYLAGIVSFGKRRCGQSNFPAVYTRVGAYVDWITEQIAANK